ncbi:uracil-DNA glycosylase family protein [Marinicella sp. W31]|uniref:uracil-DNA glycosylase family protein n=1 Tax=Marinicella sp. W31 TaxID=3023713 RepID=UPI0037576D95
MSETFDHLIQEIKNCRICEEHLPLEPRPIFQIAQQAKILIVGQAPGIRAHDANKPFNDPSGDRLRDWMGVNELTFYDPEKIALLPMGFCYPGTAERGDLPPRPECAQQWRPLLEHHLKDFELTLLIGQYAIKWYLKKHMQKNLTETVKSGSDYWPDYVPLPHPSPRNNIWLSKNPWFEVDVIAPLQLKIKSILDEK